jgi:citrate synthase
LLSAPSLVRSAKKKLSKEKDKMTSAPAPTGKGLEGVVLGDSTISNVEGTIGRLSYRGYLIQDLAANSTFEEVLYLII